MKPSTSSQTARVSSSLRRLRWLLLLLVAANACDVPEAAPSTGGDVDATVAQPAPDNTRERFDQPPLPDSEVHGRDDDGDHIRDDIERYIDDRFADEEWARLAMRQLARAYHHRLLAADDRDAARAAYNDDTYGFECLIAALGVDDASRERDLLRAEIVDTETRLVAYLKADDLIRGSVYRLLNRSIDGCAFDLEGLAP